MKKIKWLTPIIGVATIASMMPAIVSCSSTDKGISVSVSGETAKKGDHAEFTFKFNNFESGDVIVDLIEIESTNALVPIVNQTMTVENSKLTIRVDYQDVKDYRDDVTTNFGISFKINDVSYDVTGLSLTYEYVVPYAIDMFAFEDRGGETVLLGMGEVHEGIFYPYNGRQVREKMEQAGTTELIIPAKATVIADDAFCNLEYSGGSIYPDFTERRLPQNYITAVKFEKNSKCKRIEGGTLTETLTEVYSEVEQKNVQTIALKTEGGFLSGLKGDWTLELPNSLETIGQNFLSECFGFGHKVILPDSVKTIGAGFMYNCNSYNQEMVLPSRIKTIPAFFMRGCWYFNQEFIIPNTVTIIQKGFLSDCPSFNQDLIVPDSVKSIGYAFLFEDEQFDSLIKLPNTLKAIPDSFLLNCYNFSQPIELPDSLLSIGKYFLGKTSFQSPIVFPDELQSIDDGFLYSCTKFNSPIVFNDNLVNISGESTEEGGPEYDHFYGFLSECTYFNQPLQLPKSLTTIGDSFLYGCHAFNQAVKIPDNVLSIGNDFLRRDYGLVSPVILSSQLGSIGSNFMSECVSYPHAITIPDSVVSIGANFLRDSTQFDSKIIIGENSQLQIIYSGFLYGCHWFNQPLNLPESLLYIGDNFLYDNYMFNQDITIPENVFYIGDYFIYMRKDPQQMDDAVFNSKIVFEGDTALKHIGDYFLGYCPYFNQNITLPNSLGYVGKGFLYYCYDMISTIDIQDLDPTVFDNTDDISFVTNSSGAPAYDVGIAISGGLNVQAFLRRFPQLSSGPYRYLYLPTP